MKVAARPIWCLAMLLLWWPLFCPASPREPLPPGPGLSLHHLEFAESYGLGSWGNEQESIEGFYLLTPLLGTDATLTLTLWNAEINKSYDILYSRELPGADWSVAVVGALGQTNFTVPPTNLTGFYRAAEGADWDGDGVKNRADAQPSNRAVSNLVVTIEFPAAGATVD